MLRPQKPNLHYRLQGYNYGVILLSLGSIFLMFIEVYFWLNDPGVKFSANSIPAIFWGEFGVSVLFQLAFLWLFFKKYYAFYILPGLVFGAQFTMRFQEYVSAIRHFSDLRLRDEIWLVHFSFILLEFVFLVIILILFWSWKIFRKDTQESIP